MINFIRKNIQFSKVAGINLFSKIGDRLFYTSMLSAASMVEYSKFTITLVSISETFPIVLSFILGNIADRRANKFNSMAINAFFRMLIYIIIGFLFSFTLTFNLLILIILLNFISGILGNYSSALIAPFTKILVSREDMEKAQGIISLSSQLVNIISTFGGSILIAFFAFRQVAWINAIVFLMIFLSLKLLKRQLKDSDKNINISKSKHSILIDIKENFKSLTKNKRILNDIIQLMMINGFFGGMTPIFVIALGKANVFGDIPKPIWIATLSVVITISMIIGNAISSNHFRDKENYYLNNLCNILIMISGITLMLKNLLIVIVISGAIGIILGIVSPRFTAEVVNSYPVEKLGGLVTTVNALLIVTPPLASIIFPLISSINTNIAYLSFTFYGLTLILISLSILRSK